MFLINFQLWARSRKIPGGGSFNIRGGGGVNKRGKRLVLNEKSRIPFPNMAPADPLAPSKMHTHPAVVGLLSMLWLQEPNGWQVPSQDVFACSCAGPGRFERVTSVMRH